MAEADSLLVSVSTLPVVQDRTELQLSDGMDDGETKDPPPREQ